MKGILKGHFQRVMSCLNKREKYHNAFTMHKRIRNEKVHRLLSPSLNGNNALPEHPREPSVNNVNRNTIVNIMSRKLQKQRGEVYNYILNA